IISLDMQPIWWGMDIMGPIHPEFNWLVIWNHNNLIKLGNEIFVDIIYNMNVIFFGSFESAHPPTHVMKGIVTKRKITKLCMWIFIKLRPHNIFLGFTYYKA
ncbi:hypothetical protein ACJX0J_033567, partial [Zea mays]